MTLVVNKMRVDLLSPPILKIQHELLHKITFHYIAKVTKTENLNLFKNLDKLKIYHNNLRNVNGMLSSYFCKVGKYAA